MPRTLILFAHPALEKSHVHRHMIQHCQDRDLARDVSWDAESLRQDFGQR